MYRRTFSSRYLYCLPYHVKATTPTGASVVIWGSSVQFFLWSNPPTSFLWTSREPNQVRKPGKKKPRQIRTAPHQYAIIRTKSAPARTVPHQRDLVENAILCSLGQLCMHIICWSITWVQEWVCLDNGEGDTAIAR